MKVSSVSHVGYYRKNNEDAYAVDEGRGVFIVCDGMGGANGGEVASAMTAELVKAHLEGLAPLSVYAHASSDSATADKSTLLTEAVKEANKAVYRRGSMERGLKGMGTTIVAAVLTKPVGTEGAVVVIAHVGDSRAYILRPTAPSVSLNPAVLRADEPAANLYQITRDHTVAEALRQSGYSEEQISAARAEHVITDAVGVDKTTKVTVNVHEVLPGDVLLLCSDGLHGELDASTIAKLLYAGKTEADGGAAALLDAALKHGGKDNVTFVVVRT